MRISDEALRGWQIEYITNGAKRYTTLSTAGKDSAGLNATIDRFVAEAASRDVAIEFHNIRGAPHAFDIQTPSPEVRSVIARVIAFMKASLEQ